MNFLSRARQVFEFSRKGTNLSLRKLEEKTNIPKSSLHRHREALQKRLQHPESYFWETQEGQKWLIRLVVSTIYTFGLKRGVGSNTISEFFKRIRIDTHTGCSPESIQRLTERLEEKVVEFGKEQQNQAIQAVDQLDIIPGVDETFMREMILVMMELSSGYLLMEEFSTRRDTQTWKEKAEEALKGFPVKVRYFVSDRARALVSLAKNHFQCPSVADTFHGLHELVKGFALVLQTRLRQAECALAEVQEDLENSPQWKKSILQQSLQARVQEVQNAQENQEHYQSMLHQFSMTLHPFSPCAPCPRTSKQVETQLYELLDQFQSLAKKAQLSNQDHLDKVRKQVPDLSLLIDLWWEWVRESLETFCLCGNMDSWLQQILLPVIYWKLVLQKIPNSQIQDDLIQLFEKLQLNFQNHPITQSLTHEQLLFWQQWATRMVSKFQRTSSAVEGRNGYLSQINYSQRGMDTQRLKVLTVIHNFDIHDQEGKTPAQRLFNQTFPDLFESILSHVQQLPRPRSYAINRVSDPLNSLLVPL